MTRRAGDAPELVSGPQEEAAYLRGRDVDVVGLDLESHFGSAQETVALLRRAQNPGRGEGDLAMRTDPQELAEQFVAREARRFGDSVLFAERDQVQTIRPTQGREIGD